MYAHVLFYGRSVRGQPLRQYFHPLQAGRGMGLLMDVDGSPTYKQHSYVAYHTIIIHTYTASLVVRPSHLACAVISSLMDLSKQFVKYNFHF